MPSGQWCRLRISSRFFRLYSDGVQGVYGEWVQAEKDAEMRGGKYRSTECITLLTPDLSSS